MTTVDNKSLNAAATEAMEGDRVWFKQHPDVWQCIRPMIAGEFDIISIGKSGSILECADLPVPEAGEVLITLVSVVTADRCMRVREPVASAHKINNHEPVPNDSLSALQRLFGWPS